MFQYKRKRKREREVEYEMIERMMEELGIRQVDMAALLGITAQQIRKYRLCGKVPADRFYGARDALLLDVEERARKEREQIIALFSATPLV